MQINDPKVKSKIKSRLARIEGQLRGIQKMIDEERDCREIMQQLIAVRSAVHASSLIFMREVASDCMLNLEDQNDPQAWQATLNDIIDLLGKVSA